MFKIKGRTKIYFGDFIIINVILCWHPVFSLNLLAPDEPMQESKSQAGGGHSVPTNWVGVICTS